MNHSQHTVCLIRFTMHVNASHYNKSVYFVRFIHQFVLNNTVSGPDSPTKCGNILFVHCFVLIYLYSEFFVFSADYYLNCDDKSSTSDNVYTCRPILLLMLMTSTGSSTAEVNFRWSTAK